MPNLLVILGVPSGATWKYRGTTTANLNSLDAWSVYVVYSSNENSPGMGLVACFGSPSSTWYSFQVAVGMSADFVKFRVSQGTSWSGWKAV